MKKLDQQFDGRADQRGYRFKQLKREGNLAIFEKFRPTLKNPKIYYEVVFVQSVPLREFPNGEVVAEHESLPSSSKWGSLAWSPATLAKAEEKFYELQLTDAFKG